MSTCSSNAPSCTSPQPPRVFTFVSTRCKPPTSARELLHRAEPLVHSLQSFAHQFETIPLAVSPACPAIFHLPSRAYARSVACSPRATLSAVRRTLSVSRRACRVTWSSCARSIPLTSVSDFTVVRSRPEAPRPVLPVVPSPLPPILRGSARTHRATSGPRVPAPGSTFQAGKQLFLKRPCVGENLTFASPPKHSCDDGNNSKDNRTEQPKD